MAVELDTRGAEEFVNGFETEGTRMVRRGKAMGGTSALSCLTPAPNLVLGKAILALPAAT